MSRTELQHVELASITSKQYRHNSLFHFLRSINEMITLYILFLDYVHLSTFDKSIQLKSKFTAPELNCENIHLE